MYRYLFLISYYQVYKELNLCFLLLPNFKTQVAKKQQIGDMLDGVARAI